MEALARYILKRCDMISVTPTFAKKKRRWGCFTVFYIQRRLLEKYSDCPIPEDCDRIEVIYKDMREAFAALGHSKWGYELYLPSDMFYGRSADNEEFLGNLMHELTHLVNDNGNGEEGNVYAERKEIGSKVQEIIKDLVYYFQDSEMNAHLAGFYYELKSRYSFEKDDEDGHVYVWDKRWGKKFSDMDILCLILKRSSNKLGWYYMNRVVNAISKEEEPSKDCYSFSTFPRNGNKDMRFGWGTNSGPYSNMYFAILYILKRWGNGGDHVLKIPGYEFYYGKPDKKQNTEKKWVNGRYEYEFEDMNSQELAMKYVLLKNKIRNQLFQKWEDFNKRADKIFYMWYEEELGRMNGEEKKTVFQRAVNEAISEGGKAVASAGPIRGDLAGEIARDVIASVSRAFGCDAEPAGSTGKKGPEMTSGDVDILLNMPWERSEEVAQWIQQSFPGCEMKPSPGFKEISFGYPYTEDGQQKIAQVDLMFTSNMAWRRASVYSPSPYESKFKGLVREVLIRLIAKATPIDEQQFPKETYTAEDYDGSYDGQLKSWWRYMWDGERGLLIVHRSNVGKKRPIKSYTVKEDTIVVTTDVDQALKIVLGPDATFEDVKSPETIVAYLFSGKFKNPEALQTIHDYLIQNEGIQGIPGAVENIEALWNEYAGKQEPAYSAIIQEMRDLYRRMKKTED